MRQSLEPFDGKIAGYQHRLTLLARLHNGLAMRRVRPDVVFPSQPDLQFTDADRLDAPEPDITGATGAPTTPAAPSHLILALLSLQHPSLWNGHSVLHRGAGLAQE